MKTNNDLNIFTWFCLNNFLYIFILVFFLSLVACSTASSSFESSVKALEFHSLEIQGKGFKHTIYKNNNSDNTTALHVYLGSDGTPWFKGKYVTNDPTPLKPVMLRLMSIDKSPAIYLGRPCYHKQGMPKHCNSSLWTNKRYSQEVVDSMGAALQKYMQQYHYKKIKLFGFSGGGTLAMLLASKIKETDTLITLAGNLDIDAWTSHHGYLPLAGSLNPANLPPLSSHIRQLHFIGDSDTNISAEMLEAVIHRQKNAQLIRLKQVNHHCCWLKIWKQVLQSDFSYLQNLSD